MTSHGEKIKGLDVSHEPLGVVYARALLGAAEQAGQADVVADELASLVHEVLDKFPDFEALLASPRIAPEDKLSILDRVFSSRVSPVLLTFLKVVARRGRLGYLRTIDRAAQSLRNELLGRLAVRVTTAQPIDPQLTARIASVLKTTLDSDIDLTADTDPTLIGGMVVRVGDTVYDASVADRLRSLRHEAVRNTSEHVQQSLDRFVGDS